MDKDNTDYQYWKSYYDSDEIIDKGEELQLSISRTRNGSPISDQTWNPTKRCLNEAHHVMPLCINSFFRYQYVKPII